MTITELFEAMPERLNPAAAAGMTKILQWHITGDEPGVWALQIVNGVGQLVPGGVEKPDTTFTVSGKDWLAISEGKLVALICLDAESRTSLLGIYPLKAPLIKP